MDLVPISTDALLQLCILALQRLCLLLFVHNLAVFVNKALVYERLQLLARGN